MNTYKKYRWLALAFFMALIPWEGQALSPASSAGSMSNEMVLIITLGIGLVILLSIFAVLAYVAYSLLDVPEAIEEAEEEKDPFWSWFWNKFNAAVPQSQEKDALLDHDYDGIQELDNDMPPWWKYGFYLSIVFAFCYIYIYHVGETEHVSVREYQAELKVAKAQKEAYLARMESMIDESNVEALAGAGDIGEGKSLYLQNCRACHGGAGEGGVGPNLTDPYWIHGGDVTAIFSTIKYGVPENGMLSWKEKMTPKQMQQLASFILTMQGTNPPNPKEPQGELYTPEGKDQAGL